VRWSIRVLIIISLFVYSNVDFSYMDRPYYAEYPCVIMEGPRVKYILHSPGGKITAEYEKHKPWLYR
jgi:hypothetical protein